MDTIEITEFVESIRLLLGYKEVHIVPLMWWVSIHTEWKNKAKPIKTTSENVLSPMFDETNFNIESLKITYKIRSGGTINIRRVGRKNNEIKILVIPLTLYDVPTITLAIKDELFGRDVISIEFITHLKISDKKEDNDEYITPIRICGHNLYIHNNIDCVQHINITNKRCVITDIKRVTAKAFPKIPFYSKSGQQSHRSIKFTPLHFDDDDESNYGTNLCDEILRKLDCPI
jgi:hypothetical protein